MANKPRVGRAAINLIKEAYEQGADLGTKFDIRVFLNDQGIASKHLKLNAVGEWDRKARLEVHEAKTTSIPNPVYNNQYTRKSAATPLERRVGRAPDRKDVATRVQRQGIEAAADAVRDDATQAEKAMPDLYASVQNVLTAIETLSST
jgi:hypothetical protein